MGIRQTMQVLTTAQSQLVDGALVRGLDQNDDRIASEAVEAAVHHPSANVAEALIRNYRKFSESARETVARAVYRFHDFFLGMAQNGTPETRETLLEIVERHTAVDVLDLLVVFLSSENITTRRRVEEMVAATIDHYLEAQARLKVGAQEGNDRDTMTVQRALRVGLQSFPFHQSTAIVRGALRLGPTGYRLVNEALKRETRVNSAKEAIIEALIPDSSDATIAYCFALLDHDLAYFRRIGQTIFRAKRGPGQETAVLNELERLSMEAKVKLIKKNHGPVWLEVFEHRTHLLGEDELSWLADQVDLMDEREDVKLRYWALFCDADEPMLAERALARITAMRGPESQAMLLSLLDSPREEVQLAVIKELERLRHVDILKLLAPKVASKNEKVRRIASKIVAKISYNRYVAAFDKLDEHTRQVAGKAVFELDEDIIYELAKDLQAIDPAQRLKAVRIIEATGSHTQLEDAVLHLVNDPDKKVRATIIHLLAAMKNAPAIKALVRLLSDKDARVQANVLDALKELKQPEFRQLIVPFLKSPNNRVRGNACHALWVLGVHKVSAFMFEMLKSRSVKMRLSGIWVIAETKPEGGLKALALALADEETLEVKTAIRRAMKRFEDAADSIEEGGQ